MELAIYEKLAFQIGRLNTTLSFGPSHFPKAKDMTPLNLGNDFYIWDISLFNTLSFPVLKIYIYIDYNYQTCPQGGGGAKQ